VVITAGELTMEMLDLRFDPVAKFYEAPAHVKAMGGIFVIDDFGRQRVEPQELVNRWIMPLETRVDLLTLHNGKKLEMPFDQLVVFSTNFTPDKLMDPAGLRRIPYKFYLDAPTTEEYSEILHRVAKARDLPVSENVLSYLLDDFYPSTGATLSSAHPAFLIDHAIQRCRFDGRELALTVEVVREATENLTLRS
jgi:predicted ATPase with chaperone activity